MYLVIFFSNAVKNLGIIEDNGNKQIEENNEKDIILGIIEKYKIHPSIPKIQENFSLSSIFKFETVTCEDIKIIINGLGISKSTAFKNKPVKIFRNHTDAFADKLTNIANHSILSCSFPDKLKCADILPAFKKGDKFDKQNYRPVSLLPTASKVFERILFSQTKTQTQTIYVVFVKGIARSIASW